MIIKQLSVFLENRAGRLTEVTEILFENDINISALSIAETADYGVIRMIVDNPEKAVSAMKKNDLSVHITDVIAIVTPDQPGALSKVIKYLSEVQINVSYMYGYSHENKASIIMKVDKPEKAVEILQSKKVELLSASQFYKI